MPAGMPPSMPPSAAVLPPIPAHDPVRAVSQIAPSGFTESVAAILRSPIDPLLIEIRPDGILYLPEVEYRSILLRAFGPGGWAMVPVGDFNVVNKTIYREYALYAHGRYVSQACGENRLEEDGSVGRALEGTKSNAIMRCCKDLGVAADLWNQRFISQWLATRAVRVKCFDRQGRTRFLWRRNDLGPINSGGFKEVGVAGDAAAASGTQAEDQAESYQPIPQYGSAPSAGGYFSRSATAAAFSPQPQSQQGPGSTTGLPTETHAGSGGLAADFHPDGTVPPKFKKYAGQKWVDMLADPQALSYLRWVAEKFEDTGVRKLATDALMWATGRAQK